MSIKKDSEFLKEKLNQEKVTVPDSLSAENIEKLIEENKLHVVSSAVEPMKKRKSVVRRMASVAAVIAIVAVVAVTAGITVNDINLAHQEKVVSEIAEKSANTKLEKILLDYYKTVYNNAKRPTYFGVGSAMKDAADMPGNYNDTASDDSSNGTVSGGSLSEESTDKQTLPYSQTNTQVDGVDEGDVIKVDGRYIYYLKNASVIIVDAEKPDKMNIVSKIYLGQDIDSKYSIMNYNNEIYFYDNKLISVTNISKPLELPEEYTSTAEGEADYKVDSYNDCCCGYITESKTVVQVFDLADKSAPKKIYSYQISGDYVSSRLINGKLVTVSSYSVPYYAAATNSSVDFDTSCKIIKAVGVPSYSINGSEFSQLEEENVEIKNEKEPTSYITTSVFNLKNTADGPKIKAIFGSTYEIYCTADNLFIAEYEYEYYENGKSHYVSDDNGEKFGIVTHISKYDITDDGVVFKSEARVGGMPLNQFSMDAYNGMFRIATTAEDSTYRTVNLVYVLDNDMKITGFLGGIAKDENIQSARFIGNTLYLVTFEQTDPLFVIDLSDGANPQIKGELKLPGFSSYLHPIGDNLIVGVGLGGNDDGLDNSAKLSLFDVSDPTQPKEISQYTVQNAYFDSNHKRFTVINENSFAVSLSKDYSEQNEIVVFDVSDGKITLGGNFESIMKVQNSYDYQDFSAKCAFIGDTIYVVNYSGIISYNMTSGNKLGEIDF